MLDDYLAAAMAAPWRWGQMDCCMFAARWIEAATGYAGLVQNGARYADARGALRIIRRAGGLVPLVDLEMQRGGFRRTASPEAGDIGVIATGGAGDLAIAGASVVICYGPRWVGRSEHGLVVLNADPMMSWKIL